MPKAKREKTAKMMGILDTIAPDWSMTGTIEKLKKDISTDLLLERGPGWYF